MNTIYDVTNTANATNQTVWCGNVTLSVPYPLGPLSRLQFRLQRRSFPLAWLGNRVADVRCWLWKLSR